MENRTTCILVMERDIPQSADQSQVDKRPIAHGLEELRTVLGDLARVALTSGSEVMKLTREDFQALIMASATPATPVPGRSP